MKKTLLIVLSLILTATWSLAQQESPPSPSADADWETKLYQLSYQDVEEMYELLAGFIKDYDASASQHFNTLTLRAPQDVHAAVRSLISQYDKPPRGIALQIYLLKGMRAENGTPQELPENIRAIVGEIASLTEFKSFELIASPQLRTLEGSRVTLSGGAQPAHEIEIGRLRVQSKGRIQVQSFHVVVHATRRASVSFRTSFEVDNEETIVLGTSELGGTGGEALVTLLTARLID